MIVSMIPIAMIIISMIFGMIKKVNIFDSFRDGAIDGMKIVYNVFPTMLALILAITMLRESGFFEIMSKMLSPLLNKIGVPGDIVPLAVLRPFSGSGATALYNNLLQSHGADSLTGAISAVMMGSSETTFYVITVYLGTYGIKADMRILIAALLSDFMMVAGSILFVNILM